MSDTIPTPPENTPDDHSQPPGFFNQAQLNDIKLGEDLQTLATEARHTANLEKRGFTPANNTILGTLTAEARRQTTVTGQARSAKKASTLNAKGPERTLLAALHEIQAAARQKQRLLEADGDPATNFDTTPYLIGKRLNANRTLLLQNSDTLIALAKTDNLPGLGDPEILLIENHLSTYRGAKDLQIDTKEESGNERVTRDALIKRINALRTALQHSADRAYPYTDEASAPARAAFKLPPDRTFVG
ncbi:MAG: hypothetical protein ABIT37_24010 [Luteolibacter sp.]